MRPEWEAWVWMEFEEAYQSWIASHRRKRTGDAGRRIENGLGHAERTFAEKVWWPAFYQFDNLHPEYAVRDFRDGLRYIDFAYIQPGFQIAIEIDGQATHWTHSQEEFIDDRLRQNDLVIDGWYVIRFPYVVVSDRARNCQRTLQQLIGRLTVEVSKGLGALRVLDREIVRLAIGAGRPITTRDIVTRFRLERHAASEHLKRLVASGWLEPASGSQRIRSYRVRPQWANLRV
ncbi:MarR family transcriptional regulator [Alicyclobacillus cycloheptanicus]|uniref:Very-short-patch-repair endonuclease n=1 Tax=Alicyclobacillus cycloheptanicus TaxID=1457 RepID=A0ABT9XH83_9BACL|nr:helix-turn-helix domain-containing protein [Alicyclobacillus cycloheptanicus]MDQ0189394.1 very-short-patch-repair endonuclease [Alicyclobacillus cycloheptanicus]WDM02270.1 MarR family transcriptional regulator [Alicyclobacillus cycloheptanicus]